jgi:hypothetical protein
MLNIINNLPEALVLADMPDCLKLLHFAHYNLGLRPYLSFVVGMGNHKLYIGDELTPRARWWTRRPRGDRQRMLPFPGYNRARINNTYTGRDSYFEIEIAVPSRHDGRYRNCPRTLTFQPGGDVDRNTLSALRIHGLTAANITDLKIRLGWQ